MKPRLVVIDVGTHQAQEVRLLADRTPRWRLAVFFSLLRHHGSLSQAWRETHAILEVQNRLLDYEFAFLMVEPIVHAEAMDALRLPGCVVFVKGVTSVARSGRVDLHLAKSGDLGHSIVATKPNLSQEIRPTSNFDFRELVPWFLRGIGIENRDVVVLRMNAEGVERDIVEWIATDLSRRLRVDVFLGSTGDIRKCFGSAAEERAKQQLASASIPFIYFTSSPASWRSALESFKTFLHVRAKSGLKNG